MNSTSTTSRQPREFPMTRWSVVLKAAHEPSQDSRTALEYICRAYWYPLYAFARRNGNSKHDAQDLTQEFFRLLLEKRWLADADRSKGRLRSFLITAMKHFMMKQSRRAAVQRRGGGAVMVPIDTEFAESRFAADTATNLGPEEIFDRQWAITLLDLTLKRLADEFAAAGKQNEFDVLKIFLAADRGGINYDEVASRLGSSTGAARVAVHRLRKRFREVYREEIAHTLPEESDVESELHHLAKALARE